VQLVGDPATLRPRVVAELVDRRFERARLEEGLHEDDASVWLDVAGYELDAVLDVAHLAAFETRVFPLDADGRLGPPARPVTRALSWWVVGAVALALVVTFSLLVARPWVPEIPLDTQASFASVTEGAAPTTDAPAPPTTAPKLSVTGTGPTLPERVFLDARAATARIESDRGYLGGGVLVAERRVLNSAHVMENAQTASVRFLDGARHTARLVRREAPRDLAVLELESPLPAAIRPAPLGLGAGLRTSASIFLVGSARDGDFTITRGSILQTARFLGETPVFQMDLPLPPTNSGAPVFDATGAVVGIGTHVERSATPGGHATYIESATVGRDALLPAPLGGREATSDWTAVLLAERAAVGLAPETGRGVMDIVRGWVRDQFDRRCTHHGSYSRCGEDIVFTLIFVGDAAPSAAVPYLFNARAAIDPSGRAAEGEGEFSGWAPVDPNTAWFGLETQSDTLARRLPRSDRRPQSWTAEVRFSKGTYTELTRRLGRGGRAKIVLGAHASESFPVN
jgi:hypothetical protein